MTKREIISALEKKTKEKAFLVMGDVYIYKTNGGYTVKKHLFLNYGYKQDIYCIGIYALSFFNGMVDIRRIDKEGNEHDIYYGRYKN